MKKKFVLSLIFSILIFNCATTLAYNSDELNRRLLSCKPSKDFDGGYSTLYQISGLTGSICIFKIQHTGALNKPDLICKVPLNKMYEITSYNPITSQNAKNRYCVMSMKSLKQK